MTPGCPVCGSACDHRPWLPEYLAGTWEQEPPVYYRDIVIARRLVQPLMQIGDQVLCEIVQAEQYQIKTRGSGHRPGSKKGRLTLIRIAAFGTIYTRKET